MRVQKVTAKNSTDKKVGWSGSKDGAASIRAEFVRDGFKRAEIDTEEVEFQPTKNGIIDMLNKEAKD